MACGKCYQYDCVCDITEMKEKLRIKQMETELLQLKIALKQNNGSRVEQETNTENIPSAKCYSIDCQAIWYDKCTSSKYKECSIMIV